ncbi:HNH endonuclease [Tissierella sp.]|uniref:HNH endonuclease n=1 Tax=Tissierella sp. TaxID=41274 RepID=UPI00304CC7EB
MAKPYAKKFYNSKAWRKCRESYIAKVHRLCEQCLKNGKHEPGYIVDHIEEITPENINNPDITLNHDNLQYLCLTCHNRKTFGSAEVVREGLMFDDRGNLVEV